MLKRSILLYTFLFVTLGAILAKPVKEAQAYQLATDFQQRRINKLRAAATLKLVWKGADSRLRSTSDPAFFIYNIGDDQGFVIVSGEDATKTILGYADEGSFQAEDMPDNLKNWLLYYQQEIEAVRDVSSSVEANAEVSTTASGTVKVAPLLGNIKWNQTKPYNLLCPLDTAGGKRNLTLSGCVAVAMSQIMKYHRWPVIGKGTHSYIDATYGLQSVDFSKTNYDWDNMLGYYGNGSTDQQDTAVATLMYHTGVAVNMRYSTTSSSSLITTAAEALVNHFGYDSEIQLYPRAYYSSNEWNTLIKNELDNARPVLYTGNTDVAGHAFVCDGYDSNNLYHINWGWGGLSNGYFELSSLSTNNPGVVGAAPEFCFSQNILTNIHPADAVNKQTNQVMLFKFGLSSTVSSVNKINNSTFPVSFNFGNIGTNTVNVRWGIGYIKEGSNTLTKLVENTSIVTLEAGTANPNQKTLTIDKPLGLSTKGVYRLYPIYKPTNIDSTSWSIMRGTADLNNCLVVTVASTNGSATILPEKKTCSLDLDSVMLPQFRMYQNKPIQVDLTIRNTGKEFYSTIGICLVSVTDPDDRTYICESNVLCPAGETKTFHLTGTVGCLPGNYYLQAQFDSTNSNSTMNYKILGPTNLNSQQVEVLLPPGPPILQLNKMLELNNGIVHATTDTIYLKANITNVGGFFDSRILALVFPSTGGGSIAMLTPKDVYIDSLQTVDLMLSGTPNLPPGEYLFRLFTYKNNVLTLLTPNAFASIYFTLTDGNTPIKQTATPPFIRQEDNRLLLECDVEIKESRLYDLYGRLIRTTKSERIVSLEGLATGLYMLQVRCDGITYQHRILKQ